MIEAVLPLLNKTLLVGVGTKPSLQLAGVDQLLPEVGVQTSNVPSKAG